MVRLPVHFVALANMELCQEIVPNVLMGGIKVIKENASVLVFAKKMEKYDKRSIYMCECTLGLGTLTWHRNT